MVDARPDGGEGGMRNVEIPAPPMTPKRPGNGGGRVVLMAPIMTTSASATMTGVGREQFHRQHQEHGLPPRTPPPAVAIVKVTAGNFGDSAGSIGRQLQRGSRVRVEGLLSKPECNGLEGTVKKLLAEDRVWVILVCLFVCLCVCARVRRLLLGPVV